MLQPQGPCVVSLRAERSSAGGSGERMGELGRRLCVRLLDFVPKALGSCQNQSRCSGTMNTVTLILIFYGFCNK